MWWLRFLQFLTQTLCRWTDSADLVFTDLPFATPVLAGPANRFALVQIHVMVLLCRPFKELFSHTAIGTEPGIGEVLERGARIDSMLRIAHSRIINVAARCAFPFCHEMSSFT
jgi:hypothetical protein